MSLAPISGAQADDVGASQSTSTGTLKKLLDAKAAL